MIPPGEEAALTAKLDALQKATGRQLVVATIPDLQGFAIEDYGYQLLRAWGVGLKDVNNGVILIVAPNERKVRVEVGYGLEPVLTDAFSSVVVNSQILPRFKAGDLPGGVAAGADALIGQLSLPDAEARAKLAAAVAEYDKAHRAKAQGGGVPLALIFWIVVLLVVVLPRLFRRGVGSRARYGAGGGNFPVWLWAASEIAGNMSRGGRGSSWGDNWGGGSGGSSWGDSGSGGGGWMGGGFGGGGGGSAGGGGASGSW